ncbi:hypothetical protein MAR_026216 [Mya arenaria]|uniref:Uncharacterized protein n=1 Tax=Mya arenaria TaxID=6604 RepID=A0ABY7ETJ5_MYAAR|nr:hypothetical protein MAR_026216 [Mya arenaria]
MPLDDGPDAVGNSCFGLALSYGDESHSPLPPEKSSSATRAVDGLRKVYEILTSLSVVPGVKKSAVDKLTIILQEHESRERCDAVPFVALLLVMSDLLPVLANLSLALQMRDAVYNAVGTLVMGAITTARSIKEHPGQNFQHLPQAIDHLTEQSFRFTRPKPNLEQRFPHIPLLEAFCAFIPTTLPAGDQAEEYDHCTDILRPDASEAAPKNRVLKNTITQDTTLRQATTTVQMLKVSGSLQGAMPNLSLLASACLFLPSSTANCE